MLAINGAYDAFPLRVSDIYLETPAGREFRGQAPDTLAPLGHHVRITVDPKDGIVVQVVDESGEVIRQMPREDQLQLARRLERLTGIALDTTA